MGDPQEEIEEYYTYADFLQWDESVRAEICDGEVYMMATPDRVHQAIVVELLREIANFLYGKPCKVFVAPFSVRLKPKKNNKDDQVFEPDVLVVCDEKKLDKRGCNGAPDFIAEVVSPSSISHDRVYKLNKYLDAGVREYWLIDPEAKTVEALLLKDGAYMHKAYAQDSGAAPVAVLPGCEIDIKALFAGV
jgi:Uma2 family endonuclease